jgi:hypothetical protein
MKTTTSKFRSVLIKIALLIFTINATFQLRSSISNTDSINTLRLGSNFNIFTPDSTVIDTTAENMFNFGDTVQVLTAGEDTVYILCDSTDLSDSLSGKVIPFYTEDIVVEVNGNYKTILSGQYGLNVTDMFEHIGKYNPDLTINPYYLDVWTELARLNPRVLRAFSGNGSRFMHLLGSDNTDPMNPYEGLRNGGYGYQIEEIINYFDRTDDLTNAPIFSAIETDMATPEVLGGPVLSWINSSERNSFKDFWGKWLSQPHFDATLPIYSDLEDQPLYINQLIELVKMVEDQNTASTKVSIILCLNILSETTVETLNLIHYLEDENTIYSIDITGVELGNEVYFPSYERLMGFSDFDHFWYYINGGNDYTIEFTNPLDFNLGSSLSPAMLADHNFLLALNSDPSNVKIGIPARNFPNTGVYPFKTANPEDTLAFIPNIAATPSGCGDDWNFCLTQHYSEMIGEGYAFDAIILHPYYTASNFPSGFGNNWGAIPSNYDTDPLTPNFLDRDPVAIGWQNFNTEYDFASTDLRLTNSFNGMVGIPISIDAGATYYTPIGNIKDLIRTRFQDVYSVQAAALDFQTADSGPQYKELWTTEWNLLDVEEPTWIPGADYGAVRKRLGVYTNTLVHAELLQEWYLKNIKLNIQPGYRHNFFTIATLQNFAANSNISIFNPSNIQDQVSLNLTTCATELIGHYSKRTTYQTMKMLKTIYDDDLKYVPTSTSMYMSNTNLAPTAFIAPTSQQKMYIYFTNMKQIPQRYIISPGDLSLIYGGVGINFTSATITTLDPQQLYSTSGKNALYTEINTAYNVCDDGDDMSYDYPDWYEIQNTSTLTGFVSCPPGVPADCRCVEVPATSTGYFVLPFTLFRLGELTDEYSIYPNPTDNYFYLQKTSLLEEHANELRLNIYTMVGNLVSSQNCTIGQKIDISNLPVGVYNVVVINSQNKTESERLVKMK